MRTHPRGFVASGILQSLATAVIGVLVLATLSYASEAVPSMEVPPKDDMEGDFVEPRPDPRQCKDATRQVNDLVREATRMQKLLVKAKLPAEAEGVQALIATAKQHASAIKSDCSQENLQTFWDAQLWEELNGVRCKAELPQQLTQIERDMKRLEAKSFMNRLKASGLDGAQFGANVSAVKQAIADARTALGGGTCEDANEAMQVIWEGGMHPGEMMGVVMRLWEINSQLKRVKNADIRNAITEVLQEVIDAANQGDFREANMALNDVHGELMRFLRQVTRARGLNDNYRKKIQALEEKIGAKIIDEPKAIPEEFLNAPKAVPAQPAQPAEPAQPAQPVVPTAEPAPTAVPVPATAPTTGSVF